MTRVRELTADEPVLTSLAESLLSVVEVMTKEVERLSKRVIDEVKTEPTCRRLMTVPGVGPLTALAFRATSTNRAASESRATWAPISA